MDKRELLKLLGYPILTAVSGGAIVYTALIGSRVYFEERAFESAVHRMPRGGEVTKTKVRAWPKMILPLLSTGLTICFARKSLIVWMK